MCAYLELETNMLIILMGEAVVILYGHFEDRPLLNGDIKFDRKILITLALLDWLGLV
jgi:hypothetical protein